MYAAKVFKTLLAAGVVSVISGCINFSVQEDNWFRPEKLSLTQSQLLEMQLPADYVVEHFDFPATDGTILAALHVRGGSDAPTVLYLGGDSFKIAEQGISVAETMATLGLSVFMADYRGYGGSEGSPSIDTMMSDAENALDVLRERLSGDRQTIVVHGFSLGSFVGAELAMRRKINGLILESTATTVGDWAHHQVPWYGKPFVRIELAERLKSQNNLERISRYSGPLLILAGMEDRITPVAMSRDLIDASSSPAGCRQLVEVRGANHGDVLLYDEARRRYGNFVKDIIARCSLADTMVGKDDFHAAD